MSLLPFFKRISPILKRYFLGLLFILWVYSKITCNKLVDLLKTISWFQIIRSFLTSRRGRYIAASVLDVACIALLLLNGIKPAERLINPLVSPLLPLQPLTETKPGYEVFGFAPYWTFDKLGNVDFEILTTFAYFGVDVLEDGSLDRDGLGYKTFKSREATNVFKKAHAKGTRVVLTLTQMNNAEIRALMDSSEAQERTIEEAVSEVKRRGIDGLNIDFEYMGDPGQDYRDKFSNFIHKINKRMHEEVPDSKVSISVYASAIKEPKIYDIAALGQEDIKIFMMAYDFGYSGSEQVIPTSPLYGYKEGKYWYDVATAVEDFLKFIPSEKLILGSAWYGYNYLIYGEPQEKAYTRPTWSWRGRPKAQTYGLAKEEIKADMEGILGYREGWDDIGKVGWKAYYSAASSAWRMMFIDDSNSLGIKYDFAKEKNLAGVGMWALGFDEGTDDFWKLLAEKFGYKQFAEIRNGESRINE